MKLSAPVAHVGIAVGYLLSCAACGASTTPQIPGAAVSVPSPGKALVYTAVGASETAGVGADIDRFRDAWPAVLYASALPIAAVYYNLGISGATIPDALTDELPRALELHPDLVTVWLNVNDLVTGRDVATYQAGLQQLVRALRQGGHARVLVANTPVLSGLPLVKACLGEGPFPSGVPAGSGCPLSPGDGQRWTAAALDAQVAAYNQAIARVVSREGAVLVDLHSQGDVATLHPEDVDREDGFHPSDAGHAAIAALFARTLQASGGP